MQGKTKAEGAFIYGRKLQWEWKGSSSEKNKNVREWLQSIM